MVGATLAVALPPVALLRFSLPPVALPTVALPPVALLRFAPCLAHPVRRVCPQSGNQGRHEMQGPLPAPTLVLLRPGLRARLPVPGRGNAQDASISPTARRAVAPYSWRRGRRHPCW